MQSSQVKTLVSVAILMAGLILTVVAVGSASSTDSSDGIIIDFGDYNVTYSAQDGSLDSLEALQNACSAEGFVLVTEGSTVVSIDGRANNADDTWGLYVVAIGSTEWTAVSDWSSVTLSDYSAVCYGYCAEGEEPAPAVD